MVCFFTKKTNCSIIKYTNKAFTIKTPKNWVLDCKTGLENGLNTVFYKNGTTWQNATTVMYLNFASLTIENQQNINDLITYDITNFKRNYKGIYITDKEIIKTKNFTAIVKYFGGGNYKNFEYMAYLDFKKFALIIVLSSKEKINLNNNFNDFKKLIKSIKVLDILSKKSTPFKEN